MIEVKNISKKYGKKWVLQDISFTAEKGERIALVGKNGCGKSTLLQIMAGVQKAASGEMHYFGTDMRKNKKKYREYCGYVPQENPLMEELSVKDNLKLWAAASGTAYQEAAALFSLEEVFSVQVKKLSGGMKRRVSIACGFLGFPPVLLLDEPSGALDIYQRECIWQRLEEYEQRQGILFLATHDEGEILKCTRCIMLHGGHMEDWKREEMDMGRIQELIFSEENRNNGTRING